MDDHTSTVTLHLTFAYDEFYAMESKARRRGNTVPDMLRDYAHSLCPSDDNIVDVLRTPQETLTYFDKTLAEATDENQN